MGLISGVLGLPLAPLAGTIAVADQVLKQAQDAYYDPAAIRAQLEDVDRRRRSGELDEEQATAWEDMLVDRLMEGQQRRREGQR
ncbi:gas vesicle protein GvpG [Nocardioides panaciterrulae]|uniref:Chorismate mutase n=1 Tax=Nocardioides panaciterrulae TaxID=661492 RepID=A0A7Y9E3U2_9ACTN|nr:gas vesicle protein GvpG [Nocardioides panaciterrulae]NYD40396.1 chorismate mutase [Nocardioides panaciterrulae]